MKVYIGPYKNWIGPYQIAEKILFWMNKDTDNRVHNFGTWLSGGEDGNSLLTKFCTWIDSNKKRNVKIRIDKYDTWNMDSTLAMIILPMLKQLKVTKHGAPGVMKEFNQTSESSVQYTFDFYREDDTLAWDKGHENWDKILDKMIWSFEQLHPDNDWEQQFHTGEIDVVWIPSENLDGNGEPVSYEMTKGPKDTHNFDIDGFMEHSKRIDEGIKLFGKYYRDLWD